MFVVLVAITLVTYVIFYCIYGSYLAIQLSKEIKYKQGFLTLWNKLQFSLVSENTEIPEFTTEKSTLLYKRLMRHIKQSYVVIIGSCIVAFLTDIASP